MPLFHCATEGGISTTVWGSSCMDSGCSVPSPPFCFFPFSFILKIKKIHTKKNPAGLTHLHLERGEEACEDARTVETHEWTVFHVCGGVG